MNMRDSVEWSRCSGRPSSAMATGGYAAAYGFEEEHVASSLNFDSNRLNYGSTLDITPIGVWGLYLRENAVPAHPEHD